nr:cupin domain-containing protein [uncultured Anaeromusa sp.]
MIKRADDLQREVRKEMLGGQGEVTLVHLLQGEEFQGKGRLFSRNIIEPGCSVGFHQHNGDVEAYYVLKGVGIFDDNGVKSTAQAGDLLFTKDGGWHSLLNEGPETLEIIALVLYS